MLGGVISGNTADWGGGLNNWNSYFIMSGGEITNNIATNTFSGGGGVAFDGISLDMTGGVIAGNRAPNGGGMYTNSGKVQLSGGVISDNTASDDGGGIYAKSLEMLYVLDGIVFANNQASTAYERLSYDDVLYHEHIGDNVVWTLPFSQGYNNYDISYISETPMPSTQANPNSRIPTYAIAFIALIICILAVVLNFYFKNKKDKQTATKLNQIQHIIYLEERHQVRIVKQIS